MRNEFEYIVIIGGGRKMCLKERPRYPSVAAFYEELDARYPSIKVFQRNSLNRPVPDVFIYKQIDFLTDELFEV